MAGRRRPEFTATEQIGVTWRTVLLRQPQTVTLPTRHLLLWSLLALQAVCASIFLYDALGDILFNVPETVGIQDDYVEFAVVVALFAGIVVTAREVRCMLLRQRRLEVQLKMASGAFAEILEGYFDQWSLTPAEADVALLLIKGFSIHEIAGMRDTKDGTIKAQSNGVYRKAGVTGRAQLVSLFIEELMGDGVVAGRETGA